MIDLSSETESENEGESSNSEEIIFKVFDTKINDYDEAMVDLSSGIESQDDNNASDSDEIILELSDAESYDSDEVMIDLSSEKDITRSYKQKILGMKENHSSDNIQKDENSLNTLFKK